MDIKRLGVGTVVGGITVYALGWVIFSKLFGAFYAANAGTATGVNRADQVVWAAAVGCLFYGALVTHSMIVRNGPVSVMAGVKSGALTGLLLWGATDFILYGATNMNNLTATIVDPLLETVRGGVTGAVIASVFSRLPGGTA